MRDYREWCELIGAQGLVKVVLNRIKNPSKSPFTKGDFQFPPLKTHHATHIFGWTREANFRSLADIFPPFGKGGSRGICLSGGEVLVAAEQRCFVTMEQCKRNKSPLTPLSQRGVKKKLQGFEWSRKIYGVLCTCRVQTTLGNDQL